MVDFYQSAEWLQLRSRVLKRYGRKCMCCWTTTGVIQVDHIKPRSKYPHLALDFNNLQVLCMKCNRAKGAWSEIDYRNEIGTIVSKPSVVETGGSAIKKLKPLVKHRRF